MHDPPRDLTIHHSYLMSEKNAQRSSEMAVRESKQGPSAASFCLSVCLLRSNELNNCVQRGESSYGVFFS